MPTKTFYIARAILPPLGKIAVIQLPPGASPEQLSTANEYKNSIERYLGLPVRHAHKDGQGNWLVYGLPGGFPGLDVTGAVWDKFEIPFTPDPPADKPGV